MLNEELLQIFVAVIDAKLFEARKSYNNFIMVNHQHEPTMLKIVQHFLNSTLT